MINTINKPLAKHIFEELLNGRKFNSSQAHLNSTVQERIDQIDLLHRLGYVEGHFVRNRRERPGTHTVASAESITIKGERYYNAL